MSLDIILPHHTAVLEASQDPGTYNTTTCSTYTLEVALREHSLRLLETMVNRKNVESPWLLRHTSPRMVCIGPHTGHMCSRQELFASIEASSKTNYLYHLGLAEEATHTIMESTHGNGSVFVTATARGFYAGEEAARLGREWVARLDWRWWGSFAEGKVGIEEFGGRRLDASTRMEELHNHPHIPSFLDQSQHSNSSSHTMTRTITVVGATGTQGGSVVRALLKDPSYHVRGLTRNIQSEKAKALSQQGVEVVEANIKSVPSLKKAFEGSYAIFAVTNFFEAFPSVGKEEAVEIEVQMGTNLAKAALATSTLQHYIWSTLPDSREVSGGTITIPHYEGKNQVDVYIRGTDLIKKTTFLWIPSYAQNIHYPCYQPFVLPGDGLTLYQLQATSPTTRWKLAGDVNNNIGLFVTAILTQSGRTLPGRIVLAAVDVMTAEEVVAAWAKRDGKNGRILGVSREEYFDVWPQWAEVMHASHVYWETFGDKAFSANGQVVLGKEELGIEGLIGTAEYFAKL
ncbi:hypothetical protein LTR86_005809 [Recurvomyces mirabilis]|nr:hypothetical protein LTR86_005809 [Recurvomyces mirabilis]